MSYRGTDYDGAFTVVYFAMAAVFVGAVIFFRPAPKPNPINSRAFGCYATSSAPPILLDNGGMHILQPGFPRIGFHLERGKAGIALTAEQPIVARLAGDRYIYSIEQPGVGLYLAFFNVINGRTYGEFDESQLAQFSMLARNGTYLPYSKVDGSICQTNSARPTLRR